MLSARDWIDTDLPDGHYREAAVEASGLEWTIIRPAWFAQDFLTMDCFAAGARTGKLYHASQDGAVPFVDARDIADVAVAALTGDGHAGKHYELRGLSSVSLPEAARIIGTHTGRTIEPIDLNDAEYETYLRRIGYDDENVHGVLFFARVTRDGELDYLSTGYRDALGRDPRSFEDFAARSAAAPQWQAEPNEARP